MPVQVSIITPVFNSERYIAQTIESVIRQTFTDWELIIVDDASQDNSRKLIEKYIRHDRRIRLVCLEKNYGAGAARNKGIALADGRFIAFLDSDDLWEPQKLETQIQFMVKNQVAFSYTSYYKIGGMGEKVGAIEALPRVRYADLLKTCSIGCLTVVYDTIQLGKVYMPAIRKRQDYALWLKILKKIDSGYGIDFPLAAYRIRKDSISGNKVNAARYQWKVYREIENLSILKASYYFLHYAFNGIIKTYF